MLVRPNACGDKGAPSEEMKFLSPLFCPTYVGIEKSRGEKPLPLFCN